MRPEERVAGVDDADGVDDAVGRVGFSRKPAAPIIDYLPGYWAKGPDANRIT